MKLFFCGDHLPNEGRKSKSSEAEEEDKTKGHSFFGRIFILTPHDCISLLKNIVVKRQMLTKLLNESRS